MTSWWPSRGKLRNAGRFAIWCLWPMPSSPDTLAVQQAEDCGGESCMVLGCSLDLAAPGPGPKLRHENPLR